MHRTARDFMSGNAKWAKIVSERTPLGFSAHYALMRSSILSLTSRLDDDGSRLINPELYHGWAANAWLYAYHANGHAGTRDERSLLLRRLSRMRACYPYLKLLPHSNKLFLRRATKYCLSDFVDDVLSTEEPATSQQTTSFLIDCLFDKRGIASEDFPFATAKMVNTLVKFGNLPPRDFDVDSEDNSDASTTSDDEAPVGLILETRIDSCQQHESRRSTPIHPLEIPSLLDSQLCTIEVFLKVGVDPTNSLGYIPNDFEFRKGEVKNTVLKNTQDGCKDVSTVLKILEQAIREEVNHQRTGLPCGVKRKLLDGLSSEVFDDSGRANSADDSEDDSIFEDRSTAERKRVKMTKDFDV